MGDRGRHSFLGDCGLTYQKVEGELMLEVGYHLQAQHRGEGFATEAAGACLDFAFHTLGVNHVCSIVDPDNAPSIRVASRLHPSHRTFINDRGREMCLFETMVDDP